MRLARAFVFAVAFAFAASIALSMWAGAISHTPLQKYAEKYGRTVDTSQYNYQPPAGVIYIIGDFVWGFAKALMLLGSTPAMVAELLAALGMPQAWANAIMFAVTFSFAAFVIYMVAGRILSTR